ncbi:hypothetical protein Sango_2743200 [Sesamum angolense]|uniref:Reverse transcriptase n=1 Tax=Sesamum angolense TaxID=2727404 RepID=A0AAE1T920_9LAMI|nr:hypothetical protein Sango_2743200 [Sesamum angolense]
MYGTGPFSVILCGRPHPALQSRGPISGLVPTWAGFICLPLGLHTNPRKSHLILSKAANGVRTSLLETLGFHEGRLPLRYLGLPLIASRLTLLDCQPLLQKIDARIRGWNSVGLSFAGRVHLIKSVLLAFEVYWAMAFLFPKGVIKEIVKRIRTFLWKGNSSSGYPKVAWESVCKPIEEEAKA